MAGVNKAIIVGNLGKDPELKQTNNGSSVCNMSIATSEKWTDRQTGEQKESVEWHKVVCFGKLAEICCEHLKKGNKCFVEGQIQSRKWQDNSGVEKLAFEIVAKEVKFL